VSVIVVNNFCDNIEKIRLFDSKTQRPEHDLSEYNQFLFQVFEPGIKEPIIEVLDNDISISAECRGYAENIVNVKITQNSLKNFVPNPYLSDRVREYRLYAKDQDGTQILLDQDCFYINDSLMGR
jgi:hypothetical protein